MAEFSNHFRIQIFENSKFYNLQNGYLNLNSTVFRINSTKSEYRHWGKKIT